MDNDILRVPLVTAERSVVVATADYRFRTPQFDTRELPMFVSCFTKLCAQNQSGMKFCDPSWRLRQWGFEFSIILLIFSCKGTLNVEGVGGVAYIDQCVDKHSIHLQSTYTLHLQHLQSQADLESSRTSVIKLFTEIVVMLKLLVVCWRAP